MKKSLILLLMAAVMVPVFAGRVTFQCTVNKKDAIYKSGETVTFTAKLLEDKKPAATKKLGYRLMYDAKVLKCGYVDGTETLTFSVKADKPGWIYLRLFSFGDNDVDKLHIKRVSNPKLFVRATNMGGIGAIVEPEKLRHSKDEPADFDEFWNGVKKELATVPVKVLEKKPVPASVIEKARIKNPENYVFSDIKVACAGGKPVSGYLTMPKNAKPKSLPALVTYHGAGMFSAKLNLYDIMNNTIVFDVNAHGIENSHPAQYYKDMNKKIVPGTKNIPFSAYPCANRDDRDTYYFKGMYMRVLRALEFVKTLPEWDGKILVVSGGSQGGAQVLVACAFDHDITLARCKVPAMCDHFAAASDRIPGWPTLLTRTLQVVKHDPAKIEKCAAYYDGVYFAKRIKCPIYLYTGFIDTTCAPTSVFAAYNNIPAGVKKSIYCVPTAGHSVPETQFIKVFVEHIKGK